MVNMTEYDSIGDTKLDPLSQFTRFLTPRAAWKRITLEENQSEDAETAWTLKNRKN